MPKYNIENLPKATTLSLEELESSLVDLNSTVQELYTKINSISKELPKSSDYINSEDKASLIKKSIDSLLSLDEKDIFEIKSIDVLSESSKNIFSQLVDLAPIYKKKTKRLNELNEKVKVIRYEILSNKISNLLARINFVIIPPTFLFGSEIDEKKIDFVIDFISDIFELEDILKQDKNNLFYKDIYNDNMEVIESFLSKYGQDDFIYENNNEQINEETDWLPKDFEEKKLLLERINTNIEDLDAYIELSKPYYIGFTPREVYSYRAYLSVLRKFLSNREFILSRNYELILSTYYHVRHCLVVNGYSNNIADNKRVTQFQDLEKIDYEALLRNVVFKGFVENQNENQVISWKYLSQLMLDFIPPRLVERLKTITFVPQSKFRSRLNDKCESTNFESDVKFSVSSFDDLIAKFLFTGFVFRDNKSKKNTKKNNADSNEKIPDVSTYARFIPKIDERNNRLESYDITFFLDNSLHGSATKIDFSLEKIMMRYLLFHEIGHMAHRDMTNAELISWNEAILLDNTDVTWYVNHSRTAGENTHKREDFAESFCLFLEEPTKLRITSPNRFNFFISFFTYRVQQRQRDSINKKLTSV